MKKMLFGLIATVMLSMTANAQTNEDLKANYEKNRPVFAKAMLQFVSSIKPSYTKGESFESFSKKVCDAKTISPDGLAILQKAFGYIQNGTSGQTILDTETGVEIANASINAYKVKDKLTFEQYLFGQTSRGFWGSLWHAVTVAAEWVWDHAEEIITTYTSCCSAKLCCK